MKPCRSERAVGWLHRHDVAGPVGDRLRLLRLRDLRADGGGALGGRGRHLHVRVENEGTPHLFSYLLEMRLRFDSVILSFGE